MDNKYNMDDKFKIDDENKNDDEIEVLEVWEPHADEITDAKDRHIKLSKKTTNRIVIALVAIGALLLMWYSTFAQPLASNNEQYQDKSWKIGFTEVSDASVVGSAKEVKAPELVSDNTVNFYISLSNVGDKITYDLAIKNDGDFNAKVSGIHITPKNKPGDAIAYSIDGIELGDVLKAGDTVHVRFEALYQRSLTAGEPVSTDMSVEINYVQA